MEGPFPPLCGRRSSVGGWATAPMCCKWASLAVHYGWWQLTDDILHDYAWATCRVVGDKLWCGHGSTYYGYFRKWIGFAPAVGLDGEIWRSSLDWYGFESESKAMWPSDGVGDC